MSNPKTHNFSEAILEEGAKLGRDIGQFFNLVVEDLDDLSDGDFIPKNPLCAAILAGIYINTSNMGQLVMCADILERIGSNVLKGLRNLEGVDEMLGVEKTPGEGRLTIEELEELLKR